MKAYLMHRDRDFEPADQPLEAEPTAERRALIEDLGLETLIAAMGNGDAFLAGVARRALLASLTDPAAIEYRQAVLRDCRAQPQAVRDLYEIAVAATSSQKRAMWGFVGRSPSSLLYRSIQVLELLLDEMRRLRRLAEEERAGRFESEGFRRFFAMVGEELDDAYLDEVAAHLERLRFKGGVLISAGLGDGNAGTDYVLRRPAAERGGLGGRIAAIFEGSGHSFRIPPRDENGARALAELRDRGLNLVAEAAAQSVDHIVSFFMALRTELGFYLGCLNLDAALAEGGRPTCLPTPLAAGAPALDASGLYDAGLALRSGERLVGNEVHADGRALVVITGANQGGKSTFLRAVGLAQLMLQCGMFVAAESFRADPRSGLFTHFRREEDASMRSGKLDEELARMGEIAEALRPGGFVLFNESFAATNEREGAEIAGQVVRALLDAGVKVFFVTHMYELAEGLREDDAVDALFLRAERAEDGRRTFRLREGEPLPTSFGADVYRRVFAGEVGR